MAHRSSMEAVDQTTLGLDRAAPVADLAFDSETIDLSYLFWVWVKWSWVLLLAVSIGAFAGYKEVQDFVPKAVAAMVVQPASAGGQAQSTSGGLGAASAQFGIQVGSTSATATPFERFKLALGSLDLAALLQEKYGLLQRVFATSWDSANQTWLRPSGSEFERNERVRKLLRQNQWSPPNLETLAEHVGGAVKVQGAKAAGFYEIIVEDADADYALWLLATVVREADAMLKSKELKAAGERRRFIESQLESRPMLYLQDTLRGLLAQELSKEMTLEANVGYAALVVEPPHLSNRRTEPNLALLFGAPMTVAGVLAFLLITLVAVVRGEGPRARLR